MKSILRLTLLLILPSGWLEATPGLAADATPPLRVVLAGLRHGHVSGFLRSLDPQVIELVGLWEEHEPVWEKFRSRPQLVAVRRFSTLSEAIDQTKPEVVWAFSDTRTHLDVVRAAAVRGVDVIVEKPLAISWRDAAEMSALAGKHGTLVLTNFETSWYPVFAEAKAALSATGQVGRPRHLYLQAGHTGPARRGTSPEFLEWLRDPERAGGGALFDFGCYGANLATWWLDNRPPESVSASLSQFDPVSYPDCDDHATIHLVYPDLQVTCVGSWQWPYARKDAALYGERGSMVTVNDRRYRVRSDQATQEEEREAVAERRNSHRWYAATVRAGHDPVEDPSSLANNLIVMKILEAARRSAAERRSVALTELMERSGDARIDP
ncbi:MAG: Gfo/Idh/MocA family oxidoreductase [Opitutaceae bacterium]|nr:Gfo/Idh/MocA family oxidoreductase [Opitutaceae bacterium]